MKVLCVIPARYASTRLPGKPLKDIAGKPMICRVYDRAVQAKKVAATVVATDDERIMKAVSEHGGRIRRSPVPRRKTSSARSLRRELCFRRGAGGSGTVTPLTTRRFTSSARNTTSTTRATSARTEQRAALQARQVPISLPKTTTSA